MTAEFHIERKGPILVFTFDRPAKYNALTRDMLGGLHTALIEYTKDHTARVLLIRAEGRYFSAGIDLNSIGAGPDDEGPSAFRRRYRQTAHHWLYDEFEALEKPIVVAHQGMCMGAALEFSLSCDFRLASSAAGYSLPEFSMGMIPGSGGTSRLVRTVGGHWARWLIMATQTVPAAQAHTIGLVHDVYPVEEFDERVEQFCLHLAEQPPEVMAAAKLAIELAQDLDRTQARNVERLINSSLNGGIEQKSLFAELRARFARKP